MGLLKDGDIIDIDANAGVCTLAMQVDDETLAQRRKERVERPTIAKGGLLEKYAATVGPADKGAVTHSGNVVWEKDPIG